MNIRSRITYLSVLGFALGIIVDVIIHALFNAGGVDGVTGYFCAKAFVEYIGDPSRAIIIEILVVGFMGLIDMGSSVVYELESWSALKATVVHYITVMVVYYPIAFYLRWLSPGDTFVNICFFVALTVAYIIIWVVQYLRSKSGVREINRELDKLKELDAKNLKAV